MTKKPYHVPRVHQAGILFKQSTTSFIEEWLGYLDQLSSNIQLTATQKSELADARPFLQEVVRLQQTSEYASVTAPQRSAFAERAQEILDRVEGTVKAVTLNQILNLI